MFLYKMTTPQEIKSHFHLKKEDYDGEIIIYVKAKNPDIRRRLMNGICLENYNQSYHYDATAEESNTQSLTRRIFVKVFKN